MFFFHRWQLSTWLARNTHVWCYYSFFLQPTTQPMAYAPTQPMPQHVNVASMPLPQAINPMTIGAQNATVPSSSNVLRTRTPSVANSDRSHDEPRDLTRRLTNNTRERIRVRDMNDNYVELNSIVKKFHPKAGNKTLTKLEILKMTTELITHFENEIAKRDLTHKLKFNPPKWTIFC